MVKGLGKGRIIFDNLNYAIIDIETTGSLRKGQRITEVAIIIFDGHQIIDRFSSLINPEVKIPYTITQLTGIDNELVKDSPKFFEIAKEIVEVTQNCIFVAHNVFFDYNFIRHEFSSLGFHFAREKLCTVRLARKYLPGHRSYSLGKICADLGISISDRHRAMGDARATVELFKKILEVNPDLSDDLVKKQTQVIPSRVSEQEYGDLPSSPGVYYFYDKEDTLLYVGKSKNIKSRVANHFRPNLQKRNDLKLKDSIARIKFKLTGSDIAAQLLECQEIKELRPYYNRAMRRKRFPFTIYVDKVSELYELKIRKTTDDDNGFFSYGSKKTAKARVDATYKAILGTEKDSIVFEAKLNKLVKTVGKNQFNQFLTKSLCGNLPDQETFSLEIQGRNPGEKAYVVVRNERLETINFVSPGKCEQIPLISSADQKRIFYNYLAKHRPKIRSVNEDLTMPN